MTDRDRHLIEMAKAEVGNDPIHGLSFKTRKGILREMGPVAARRTIGPGLIRRATLCCTMVKPALPLWEAHYPTKDPHRMIEMAEQYLAGKCTRDELRDSAYSFGGGLETSDSADKQPAYHVGRASVCAAFVAASDELLDVDQGLTLEEMENPEDPDQWDCAYWIAAAQAGGMPWEPGFDKLKYQAFWNWYLDVAVPAAWAAVPE
jgi:hypothetical protein